MATVLTMPETKKSELQTEQFPLEAEAFEGQPHREGAVSYTHLTLPTKA